jgi:hypothetical protein
MNKKNLMISPDKIMDVIKKCAEVSGGNMDKVMSKSRKKELVKTRQRSMYFLKNYTGYSLETIGTLIAEKDHATVLHSVKTVQRLIETEKKYRAEMEFINEFVVKNCTVSNPEYEMSPLDKLILSTQKSINDPETSNDKPEVMMSKISSLERDLYERDNIISDLREQLRITEGQVRLYKRKLEYASLPCGILAGG